MKEIKNAVKKQFLHIVERQTILVMFTPKEIWTQFDIVSDQVKQQTYLLIQDLVKHGYLTKITGLNGKKYYSETSKLEEFRFDHCKLKATEILTQKLVEIKQQELDKKIEIQLTNELIKEIPELDFCLEKYINNINFDVKNIIKRKNNIVNIIKNIESCIY
ncbi:hypothetical protein [Acinetobacter sp. YH01022]|jgi:hypothetical protein|uniref:hypothetical protein n=1 Tax=Acinetobacter sp. YH01022 TaxID=2601036 RepID=UPI0015D14664|nr:hypothetical protein [Acinetobacter sp. YH01022]